MTTNTETPNLVHQADGSFQTIMGSTQRYCTCGRSWFGGSVETFQLRAEHLAEENGTAD